MSDFEITERAPIPTDRRLRIAEVREVQMVSPHMKRITVGSSALEGFPVKRPAQWVKLFAPVADSERSSGRAYTIRYFYENDAEMDIDFVLHGDGPCSTWAERAKPGDVIQMAGPRGGYRYDESAEHLLIGGDETALPAIGAILEDLPETAKVTAFLEVREDSDKQQIITKARADIHWISRKGAPIGSTRELQDAMMTTGLSKENGQVWFSAEAAVVRDVRRHFVTDCGFDRSRVIAAGYWKKGETDFKDPDS